MNVVASSRVELGPLATHRVRLEDIENACDRFANQRDGVMKVAIRP
jgi:alcohol dehydrogenase